MTESSDSNKPTDETISINSNDENHSTAANDLKPENDNDLQLQIENLTKENEALSKEAETHKDNYIRGKAEVANIQLRSQQEILKVEENNSHLYRPKLYRKLAFYLRQIYISNGWSSV